MEVNLSGSRKSSLEWRRNHRLTQKCQNLNKWVKSWEYSAVHKAKICNTQISPGTHVIDDIYKKNNTSSWAMCIAQAISLWFEYVCVRIYIHRCEHVLVCWRPVWKIVINEGLEVSNKEKWFCWKTFGEHFCHPDQIIVFLFDLV